MTSTTGTGQTIPSYLYTQYADDDDLQAFVQAYNWATQYYVDWFSAVALAYYPGLSGPLLDWIGQGLYGLPRTALESPVQPAQGPLNSVVLNAPGFPLNTFAFPVVTIYSVSDDLYQRILTWDLYKADGKRFSMPWLKRRVMRFLAWTNGVDPPGVGPENTQAISAVISSGTCTVTINQSLLSLLIPNLAPNICQLFQAAFEGGDLDLPAQFTYVCDIVTDPTGICVPAAVSSDGTTTTQTTPATTAQASGGSGLYNYAWNWAAGGAGITINSSTAASTTFTASGLTPGETLSGTAMCTITDVHTSAIAQCICTVSISFNPFLLINDGVTQLTTNNGTALTVNY